MPSSARTLRIRRAALLLGGVAALGAVVAPSAAHANAYIGKSLSMGQSTCVSQYANYQVRADATATNKGAKFRLYRNGALIAASPTGTTTAWGAELRTSWGNFPGAGTYQLCGTNNNSTSTFVTLRLRTDGEI